MHSNQVILHNMRSLISGISGLVFRFGGFGFPAQGDPLKPSSKPLSLDIKVVEYAPGKGSVRFKWPTHIAFGPNNREVITDLKNNRFVFREGPEEPFQVSPVPMRGPHSVVYNPKDKLYYANDTENHRMICLLYTSPSPRDLSTSRMPSSA